MRTHICWAWTALVALACAVSAPAQSPGGEERLRDQLRQTTVQLRDAQDTIADLRSQLESSQKQVEAQRAALAAPRDNGQNAQWREAVAERDQRITEVGQQLEASQKLLAQWQGAYKQVADLAKLRDADAKRFEGEVTELQARDRTCHNDNVELARIGTELLQRYERKGGFWNSVASKEPFTQVHRAKLETLAQDYRIAIEDHTLEPAAAAASSSTPAGGPAPAQGAPQ